MTTDETPEKPERPEPSEQRGTPERSEKPDAPERSEKPEQRSKPERPERLETLERTGVPRQPEKPRQPAQPEKSEVAAGKPERPEAAAGKPEQPEKGPERRGEPDRPNATGPGPAVPRAVRPGPAAGKPLPPEAPRGEPAGAIPDDGPRKGPGDHWEPAPEPEAEQTAEEPLTGRRRLVKGVWPPRLTRAQLIVALLLFGLGLGLAIQVRSTNENSVLRGARQEDLVRILDELDARTQRLQDEKRRLESQRTELENSSDQAEEARKQTLQKEQQLGVLAGTVAAQGPGITMTINDSHGSVEADMLLDAVQELRAAGAEAIQIGKVRVVANTYFSDSGGAVEIDGRKVTPPYVVKVIGKPEDLEPALNIPGGVVQSLEKEQATVSVVRDKKIVVDALRSAKRPDYARSSSR